MFFDKTLVNVSRSSLPVPRICIQDQLKDRHLHARRLQIFILYILFIATRGYPNYLIQLEWPLTQTLGVLSASLLLASTSSRYADKIRHTSIPRSY